MMRRLLITLTTITLVLCITSCATVPPSNPENTCSVFEEKKRWYKAAKNAEKRWGTPVHVTMAIMYWESRFVDDAKPPRKRFLGIPLWRSSSAYGYAQAKSSTWDWYRDKSGNFWADRDDFEDAIDFIAWYGDQSHKKLGISKWDAYKQYLAYHEGQGGYARGSYRKKGWLINRARNVEQLAHRYSDQLASCEDSLDRGWWIF